MKRLHLNKKGLFVSIVILFIVGQLAGGIAIRYLFLQNKLSELEPQAVQMASAYVNGQPIERMSIMIIKLYDIYGSEINFGRDEDETLYDVDFATLAQKYMPKLLTAQTVSSIERVPGLPSVSVVIGVPLVKNSTIVGGLFMLMPADEYNATLLGFSIVFAATLAGGLLIIGFFFYQYLRQSRELEQTRRDYIANINHELKSPIASIKALTETLSDNLVTDQATQSRYYSIILSESNRLEKLVFDMLELSRIQSGKLSFAKQKTSPDEIFIPVCKKFETLCDDMGIQFDVTNNIKSLPYLFTNAERISQLLIILLDNAIKFVGEEGKITLDAKNSGKYCTIFVVDNGVGIGENVLPHVFERFYKEDKAHNSKGSGLGLAIAKTIVDGLHESIKVESEPFKGSTFCFTIEKA